MLAGIELPVTLRMFVPRAEDVAARGGEPGALDGVAWSVEIDRTEPSWREDDSCPEVRESFLRGWGGELAPAMAFAGGRGGYREWTPAAGALAVRMRIRDGVGTSVHTTAPVADGDENAGGVEWVRLCHVGYGRGPGLGTELTSVHFRDGQLGDLVVAFPDGPLAADFRAEMEQLLLYPVSSPDPSALLVMVNEAGLFPYALVGGSASR